MIWIIVSVAAVALAAMAWWPRTRGIVDRRVLRAIRRDQDRAEPYRNHGPNGPWGGSW